MKMSKNSRDREIIEKISRYCVEIEEAHAAFQKSYDAFVKNSVYRNAVCLCLMQIGHSCLTSEGSPVTMSI